jgi:chromosomal replication initiator protein
MEEVQAGLRSELQHDLGRSRYRLWFRDMDVVEADGDRVVLAVPTEVHRTWIEYAFGRPLRSACERVLGHGVDVRLEVGAAQGEKRTLREKLPQRPDEWEAMLAERRPKPTFASFRARGADRWAVALLEQLVHGGAERAGTIYLYGESGAGKTHLLQALEGAVHAQAPGECLNLPIKRFTSLYAAALRSGSLASLRAFEADLGARRLVLLDGLDALDGRAATQAELVRLLDRAALGGPKLVLAGRRHPRELEGLTPHLVSRLLGGPVVRLPVPDRDLLREVIEVRIAQHGFVAPPDVLEAVLDRAPAPKSAVSWAERWALASRLVGRPLEATWLMEIAPSVAASGRDDVVRRAKAATAKHFGVEPAWFDRPTKVRAAALPRRVALYLVYRSTSMPLEQLAKAFGFRSHSSASRALGEIKRERESDPALEHVLDGLLARL